MLRCTQPSLVPTTMTSTWSLSSGLSGANIDSKDAVVENTNMSSPMPPDTGRGLILGREVSISRNVSACGRSARSWGPARPKSS